MACRQGKGLDLLEAMPIENAIPAILARKTTPTPANSDIVVITAEFHATPA